ncbi:MAG: flagellar hook-length control protein FliK [Methylophagaceae bacterium]
MSQELVININNRSLITKSSTQQQDANNGTVDNSKQQQAFSSELDKQIDKHGPSKSNHSSSSERPQQPINADKRQQKAEKIDPENGKTLPAEEQNGQFIQADSTNSTPSIETTEQQLELDIDVIDGLTEVPEESFEQSLVQNQIINEDHKPTFTPAGLIKTQELHTAVQQIKESIVSAKTSEAGVSPNQTGKVISEQAQKVAQTTANTQTPVNNIVSEATSKVAVPQILNEDNAETKQQAQLPAKIRPDILQALVPKSVANSNKNTIKQNSKFESAIANKTVNEQQSTLDKQLKIPEFIKHIKPSTPPAGQFVDRVSGGFGSTLASLVNGQATSHSARVVTAEAPTLDLHPTVLSKAWSRVLSSRVIWMAKEGIQQASLKLNPASLGPVEVKVTMTNEQATVTFTAHHAATRDALEQALPRLRESFLENGLELAHSDVSQQSSEEAAEQTDGDNLDNSDLSSASASDADKLDQGQQSAETEQDIELGVSIYA